MQIRSTTEHFSPVDQKCDSTWERGCRKQVRWRASQEFSAAQPPGTLQHFPCMPSLTWWFYFRKLFYRHSLSCTDIGIDIRCLFVVIKELETNWRSVNRDGWSHFQYMYVHNGKLNSSWSNDANLDPHRSNISHDTLLCQKKKKAECKRLFAL